MLSRNTTRSAPTEAVAPTTYPISNGLPVVSAPPTVTATGAHIFPHHLPFPYRCTHHITCLFPFFLITSSHPHIISIITSPASPASPQSPQHHTAHASHTHHIMHPHITHHTHHFCFSGRAQSSLRSLSISSIFFSVSCPASPYLSYISLAISSSSLAFSLCPSALYAVPSPLYASAT